MSCADQPAADIDNDGLLGGKRPPRGRARLESPNVSRTAAGFPAVEADVRDLDYAALAGTIDVLWASPPCQAWSSANQHAGPKGDEDIARNGWPWSGHRSASA